ncbi:MAG: radical SAM protein [Acidobacteriota bacterium]
MRVTLIRNHDFCNNSRQIDLVRKRAGVLPHLGLSYMHTALTKRGHQVQTLDAQALGLTSEGLLQAMQEFQPGLVGVTATTPSVPGAVEACRVAKEVDAITILGGPHTEVMDVENLYHDCIDYVGVGEGATIMPDLADALDGDGDVSGIPGLVSREFHNGPAEMLSLEEIGWPERESTPIELYHSIMADKPFTTMISSRGCPFQCSFCFKQAVDKKSMFRTPEDVVGEMQYLVERFGVREIMFYDDIFTMKKKRVYEICELIGKRGLKVRWEAPTRVDLVDEKLLAAMARAGCVRLRFGIESGDQDILLKMRKESDTGVIEEAVRTAKRVGIQTFGYFIVGWIGESETQFRSTVDLARDIPLDFASFYTATPLPGTQLHHEAVASGLTPDDYWLRYIRGESDDRIGFLVEDAEERSREAYRRFYYRWSKVPTLARRMTDPTMAWDVVSGLASLMKSASNHVRDM